MQLLLRLHICILSTLLGLTVKTQDYHGDAVFVALTHDLNGDADPIRYDHIEVDNAKSYDRVGGRYFSLKGGIYWTSLSAGAKPAKPMLYRLYKERHVVGAVHRDSTCHTGHDTASRDIMVSLEKYESLRVRSYYRDGLVSGRGFLTSMSLFRLTGMMSSNVFFSVARQSDTDGSISEVIQFPDVLINEGKAFNTTYNFFKAPKVGDYFFSFSAGIEYNLPVFAVLRQNAAILAALACNYTTHNDLDMVSKAAMFHLHKGDLVYVSITKDGQVASSGLDRQTSFSGFLYEPQNCSAVAWSVARTTSWEGDLLLHMTFDEVLVNTGQAWSPLTHAMICKVEGAYYFTISIGALPHRRVFVSLFVNGHRRATIERNATESNGVGILSRSLILNLKLGSLVYLAAEPNTGIYSSGLRHTSFTGFLIYC